MKKLFALLILLPALFLTSCSKDDDDKDDDGVVTPAKIVGKYGLSTYDIIAETSEKGATRVLETFYEKELETFQLTSYEFKANGEFTFSRKKDDVSIKESSGTYKINNNILELTHTNPATKKDEYTITLNNSGDLSMFSDDTRAREILKAEGYPNWETVTIREIRKELRYARGYF